MGKDSFIDTKTMLFNLINEHVEGSKELIERIECGDIYICPHDDIPAKYWFMGSNDNLLETIPYEYSPLVCDAVLACWAQNNDETRSDESKDLAFDYLSLVHMELDNKSLLEKSIKHKKEGGKAAAANKKRIKSENILRAVEIYNELTIPKRYKASLVANRMGVTYETVRRYLKDAQVK